MAKYYRFKKDSSSRKPGVVSFKEALAQLLDTYQLKSAFDETYIAAHWEKIMGKPIAARTTTIYVREGILYLQLDSAPLREELVRGKTKILQHINDEMGQKIISDIVYI